ncbi:MAG: V-type ATP synthase subunit E [Oscillospiraceae bacterium]|jgi:V/A-type H+-transporting ATPase subunit E|nr:V-type ATP synthase subunit E [Oscillospiraceae bacterium]
MANTDEKKDKFYIAINHYAEEQRKKIEDEIAAFKEKELGEAEIEVLTECYLMIQKEMAKMRTRISREMAVREMESRHQLLQKRQKIADDVFQHAAEKLTEFTKTDRYSDYLKKAAAQISKVLQGQDTVIFIKPGDEQYEEIIRNAFQHSCSFQTLDSIRIGGIKARSDSMGLFADETLDALLESQRSWFEEQFGKAVV